MGITGVSNLKVWALLLAAMGAAMAAAVLVSGMVGTKPAGASVRGANGKIAIQSDRDGNLED